MGNLPSLAALASVAPPNRVLFTNVVEPTLVTAALTPFDGNYRCGQQCVIAVR